MSRPTLLAPVDRPQSLKDIAYLNIKEAILTLRFNPGHSLSNRELAAQLGISETPIRDALQELEREGFVTRIPQKGTFVTEIDFDEIQETFRIRAVLEELVVCQVAETIDAEQFVLLEQILADSEKALRNENRTLCSTLGAQFHQQLIEWAGGVKLTAILNNLEDHLKRFRLISDNIYGRLEKSQLEHRHVLKMLKEGTPAAAGQAMRTHLESVLADIQSNPDTINLNPKI